jgi:hypothetical protein
MSLVATVAVMQNRAGLLVALGADNFGPGLFLPVVLLSVTRVVGCRSRSRERRWQRARSRGSGCFARGGAAAGGLLSVAGTGATGWP